MSTPDLDAIRARAERRSVSQANDDVFTLLDEVERLRRSHFYLAEQYGRLLAVHESVVMDTPEDQALHQKAVAAFKAAIDATAPTDATPADDESEQEPEPVPVVHLLNAYTWAGRRGACGVTSESLNSVHDRESVTCPDCLAAATTADVQ